MRKITENSINAFFCDKDFSSGNMAVLADKQNTRLLLHGNCIATKDIRTGKIILSDCGWQTTTTKERLNGILDFLNIGRIYQKDFTWYWKDGKTWKSDIVIN